MTILDLSLDPISSLIDLITMKKRNDINTKAVFGSGFCKKKENKNEREKFRRSIRSEPLDRLPFCFPHLILSPNTA